MAKGSSYQSPQEFRSASVDANGDAGGNEQSQIWDSDDSGKIDPAQIDAASGGSSNIGGPEKGVGKKRGRKPGWRKPVTGTAEKANATLDIASFNQLIYNGHMMLAKIAKVPEIALDEDEAQKLANATANVARHYNIAVSQKTLDWTNFATAICGIYGTRLIAIANKKRQEANARPIHTGMKPDPVKPPPAKPYDPLSPENMQRNRETVDQMLATARGHA